MAHCRILSAAAGLLASLVMVSVPGQGADTKRDDERVLARELIATMNVDEQAVQKIEDEILRRCRVVECDADVRKCLMNFDHEEIARSLVIDALNALSADEMRQAIAYFRTEVGLRHLDILRAEQGLGGHTTLYDQTAADRARMLAFLDTRAGYLIITRGVLTSESDRRVVGRAELALWRCKPRS